MDKRRTRTRRAVSLEQHQQIQEAATPSLERAIQNFIDAKISERTAPRTVKDYARHLRYLRQWLDERYPDLKLSRITTVIIREYISWMTNEKVKYDGHPWRPKSGVQGVAPGTVNIRIRTMKAFFNWCVREGYIDKSPMADIKQQRVDTDKVIAFNEHQIKQLLAAPDRNSFPGFRDYVIMVALLDTGLRIGELMALTVNDIDFSQLALTVPWEKAKTRKTRTVPISKGTAKLLAELIRENVDFGSQADRIFYSGIGNPMRPDVFDERLKVYRKQAAIEGVRVSAHTFRHTFALHWIKSGGDPFSLQKMLGHTDMSMVRRYVRLSDGDVKEKHLQFSPIHTLLSR